MFRQGVPLAFLFLFFLVACGDKHSSNPVNNELNLSDKPLGTLVLNISVAPWHPILAKIAAVQTMDSVKVLVYSSSGSKVTDQRLTLNGTRWQGDIAVPAQNNMRVVLGYFGGSSVRYLGEKTGVNVASGETKTVDITVNYLGLSVSAPDSAAADFKVKWSSCPLATGYQLQQDTKSDFSTATQIYAGTDSTFTVLISGKTSGQTYYYRARVNTAYGYGPWYSKGGDSTVGNIAGTIIIDTPDLPDEVLTISGKITGVDGVTVTLSGDKSEKQTVNDGGTFSFTVAQGGNYMVIPSKSGYNFTPENKSFINIMDSQKQDYSAVIKLSYFTIGSTMDDVKAAQGTPSSIDNYSSFIVWHYGLSSVTFSSGNIVQGFDNYEHNLNADMGTKEAGKTFTISSNQTEVIAAQGTPSGVDYYSSFIVWHYGLSSVKFSSGNIVQGFDNYEHNLNVDMGSKEAGKTFTISSNQTEVIAAQGTPSGVDYYSSFIVWHYGLSSVKFTPDTKIVQSYDNYDNNLNIR